MNIDRVVSLLLAAVVGAMLAVHWCAHPMAEPVRAPLNDVSDKITLSQESLSKISQEVWRLLEQHDAVKAAEQP